MKKLKGLWQIIRPLNCLMMGFAVIVGASLVTTLDFSENILFGFLTSFSLTAASMVTNDYYDRKIDAINEPNRPIPRGDVSPKEAIVFAIGLSVTGLIFALITNSSSFFMAIIALIISLTYITKGKSTGLPGNFLVSATVLTPIIYGGLAIGELQPTTLIFVAIIFFSNTGREIIKGIVDIEGDKSHKIRTIAVKYGERSAAILAAFFSIIAVLLSPLPWIWNIVSNLFLPLVIITDLGLITSSIMLLRNHSQTNAKKIKNFYLIWFITGLMAFIIGTI